MDTISVNKAICMTLVVLLKLLLCDAEVTVKANDACRKSPVCSCVSTLVDCKGRNLKEFPKHSPPDTTKIDIFLNDLENLPQKGFGSISNMRMLDLSYNKLTSLPGNLFSGLLMPYLLHIMFIGKGPKIALVIFAIPFIMANGTTSNIKAKDACGIHGVCCCHSKNKKEVVNCKELELTTLPSGIPANVSELDLSMNQLKSLSELTLQNPSILEKLFLHLNQIKFIGKGVFAPLTNLRELNLAYNQLVDMDVNILPPLVQLRELNLAYNQLVDMDVNILSPLVQLRKLSLEYCNISASSTHFVSGMIHLQTLHISGNRIKALSPDSFLNMTQLYSLDLSENDMVIPSTYPLMTLRNLQLLVLSGNRIEKLPEESFQNFHNMIALRLTNDKLRDIPDFLVTSMVRLTDLQMEDNRITEIRKIHFSNLQLLRTLYLSRNEIYKIEKDSFVNLYCLDTLELSGNNLAGLPAYSLTSTNVLRQLYLSNNNLHTLPTPLFGATSGVENIELRNNELKVIPREALSNLRHLGTLDLSKNRIVELDENSFSNLTSLENLIMMTNELSSLPPGIFRHLKKLRLLNLMYNYLTVLSHNLLKNQKYLDTLLLQGNCLHNIPHGVFSTLKHLHILDLSRNNLDELPEELAQGGELQQLIFSNNKLKRLPMRGLGNAQKISLFQFSKNSIEFIDKQNWGKLVEVNYFYMSNNEISSLPWDLFIEMVISKTLDFSNNQLTSLPLKLFNANNRTHKLEVLFLHRNRLQYLQRGIFHGLPLLKSLCLFYNNIQTLADDTFEGFGGGKIYLFENNLTFLSHSAFNNNNISEIHLYGNDIAWISKTALNGMTKRSEVFIDCGNVQGLQQPDVKVKCVTPQFVPTIQVDKEVGDELGREGFECTASNPSNCSPCKRGTYGDKRNGCIPCPPGGFYEDEIGKTISHRVQTCKRCRNGTYVKSGGGKTEGDCAVCPDGTNKQIHAGYRACFCLDQYARVDRFGQCFLCLEKGIDCSGKEYKSLQSGFYWSWNFSTANLTNYKKFVENIENRNGTFDSNTKYIGEIPRAFPCPRRRSCNNAGGSVEVACSLGYKGWLCSKCEVNFYSVLNYCLICPKPELLYLQTVFIVCLFVICCACWFRFYKQEQRRSRNERSIMDTLISQGKIVLAFYQVIGKLFTSLHDVNWTNSLKYIGDIISIIELNIFQLFVRPQCFNEKLKINPKVEFVIAMTYLAITVLVPFVTYHMVKIIYSKFKSRFTYDSHNNYVRRLRSKIVTIVIIMLFLTYPTICTITFQIYPKSCEKFCLDNNNNTCKVLLRSDYELECKDLSVYHIFAYFATAGYIIAYPTVLFFVLRARVKVGPSRNRGNIYIPLKENDGGDVINIMNEPAYDGPNAIWMDFLCESYKSQFWYWEILELTRKVLQTALITLLGWKDRLTVLATIGVSVLFLTLHARYMPMKRPFEQKLQMFSLVAILVNVVVAAMDVQESYGDATSVALIFLNIVVLVIIAGELLFGMFIRIKQTKLPTMILRFCTTYIPSFFVDFPKVSRRNIETNL